MDEHQNTNQSSTIKQNTDKNFSSNEIKQNIVTGTHDGNGKPNDQIYKQVNESVLDEQLAKIVLPKSEKIVLSHQLSEENIWRVYKQRMHSTKLELGYCSDPVKFVASNKQDLKMIYFLLKVLFHEQTKVVLYISNNLEDAASRSVFGLFLNNMSLKIALLSFIVDEPEVETDSYLKELHTSLKKYEFNDPAQYLILFKLTLLLPIMKILKNKHPDNIIIKNVYDIEFKDIGTLVMFLRNTKHGQFLKDPSIPNIETGNVLGEPNIDKYTKYYINKVTNRLYFRPDEIMRDEDFNLDMFDERLPITQPLELKREFSINEEF